MKNAETAKLKAHYGGRYYTLSIPKDFKELVNQRGWKNGKEFSIIIHDSGRIEFIPVKK